MDATYGSFLSTKACYIILVVTKAELLQLKLTPIICLMNFINKKVEN